MFTRVLGMATGLVLTAAIITGCGNDQWKRKATETEIAVIDKAERLSSNCNSARDVRSAILKRVKKPKDKNSFCDIMGQVRLSSLSCPNDKTVEEVYEVMTGEPMASDCDIYDPIQPPPAPEYYTSNTNIPDYVPTDGSENYTVSVGVLGKEPENFTEKVIVDGTKATVQDSAATIELYDHLIEAVKACKGSKLETSLLLREAEKDITSLTMEEINRIVLGCKKYQVMYELQN